MKDTYTRIKEQREAEARKMIREAAIMCGTIIILSIIIFAVLLSRQ